MTRVECIVLEQDAGTRLDAFLSKQCEVSRNLAQQLIAEGNVMVNGRKPAKSHKLTSGERLVISIPPPREIELIVQDIPLDIAYEDADLLVVNKPKGMVVHPAAGNYGGTLVNALMHHCKGSLSGIGGELRPGIVHRIDKDTSGLLVVAKNDKTHNFLARQFAEHSTQRIYSAVVYGRVKQLQGVIDAPIGRSSKDRKKMAVGEKGAKSAITHYTVLEHYNGFSYLELKLQTGRTHQIRVHMAQLGYPLAGDAVYGPKKVIRQLQGQCLHAGTLGFVHPKTQEEILFHSPLPEYFAQFIQKLRNISEGEA